MFGYAYGKRITLVGFDDYFQPERTAVLSLGMTFSHLDEPGESSCPAPRGLEVVGAVDDFNSAARALSIPVIHVRTVSRPQRVEAPHGWTRVMPLVVGEIPNMEKNALEGTRWARLVTRVEASDLHVIKKGMSGFTGSDLDFLLRSLRVDTVLLNGILTECCVLNTAFDAANLRYKVVVPPDLTRGYSDEMESAALKVVSLHLGLVVEAVEVRSAWRRAAERTGRAAERTGCAAAPPGRHGEGGSG